MLNPGGSVKDRIGLPMIEAAERGGPAQAGRHDHRADVGQHRARPGDRRRAQGLPLHLRHGRQAVGREAGAAAGVRRRGRPVPDQRRARVAGELLLGRGPPRPRHPGRVQARPVLERGEPGRPRADDRPRDLGPDRGADHAPRRARRDRRHGQRHRPLPARRRTRRSRSSARTPRAASCRATPRGRTSPRASARTSSPAPTTRRSVDRWVRVSDRDAFAMARRITREEGILAGESCGTAMLAALDEAARLMREEPATARRRGRRRDPPRRRPELPLQALQRRVDARQRPAADDRGRRRGSGELLARPPPRPADPRRRPRPDDRPRRRWRSTCSSEYGISQLPVSEQPDGRRARRDRRLGQREGPARPRLPQPRRRRADGRRGHGPAAADDRRRRRPSTRRSRCCRAAPRRCSRSAAAARPAS